eukprot:1822183-Pyramimonas_sp.AAC.1
MHKKHANIDGATVHRARYIGGLQTSAFAFAPELAEGLRGLRAALYSMGHFWTHGHQVRAYANIYPPTQH